MLCSDVTRRAYNPSRWPVQRFEDWEPPLTSVAALDEDSEPERWINQRVVTREAARTPRQWCVFDNQMQRNTTQDVTFTREMLPDIPCTLSNGKVEIRTIFKAPGMTVQHMVVQPETYSLRMKLLPFNVCFSLLLNLAQRLFASPSAHMS